MFENDDNQKVAELQRTRQPAISCTYLFHTDTDTDTPLARPLKLLFIFKTSISECERKRASMKHLAMGYLLRNYTKREQYILLNGAHD